MAKVAPECTLLNPSLHMIDFRKPTAGYVRTSLGGRITKQPTTSWAASGPSRTTADKWRQSRRPLRTF